MWLILLILCCLNINFINAADVGDECTPNNDIAEGVCTAMTECQEAIRAIRKKNFHPFERCGFDGDQEIVCCPHTTSKFGSSTQPTPTNTGRQTPAERECQKIIARHIQPLDLHIIGGEMASVGEFPHMVAIGFDRGNGYVFDCGGTLISAEYVLTAAHCVDTLDRIQPSMVRVGTVEAGGAAWDADTDVAIASITPHPQYTRREKYHDLALLRLSKPVEFSSTVNAACLFASSEDPARGVALTITGWGQTSTATEQRSDVLLKANVTMVPRSECTRAYAGYRKLPRGLGPEQLCAGDPDGLRDTCQGDSGGPLQIAASDGQYRVVGITSFGRGCGSPVPGVYTRVSHYREWIESVVWP